jgi:hypothetical protein
MYAFGGFPKNALDWGLYKKNTIIILIINCGIEAKFPLTIATILKTILMYESIIVTDQAHPLPFIKP